MKHPQRKDQGKPTHSQHAESKDQRSFKRAVKCEDTKKKRAEVSRKNPASLLAGEVILERSDHLHDVFCADIQMGHQPNLFPAADQDAALFQVGLKSLEA